MTKTISWLSIFVITIVLLSSSIVANPMAFAHNAQNNVDPPGSGQLKVRVSVTLNSLTLDQTMDDPLPPDYADDAGTLDTVWWTSNPGTYTFDITDFENLGSYCGDDKITITIP